MPLRTGVGGGKVGRVWAGFLEEAALGFPGGCRRSESGEERDAACPWEGGTVSGMPEACPRSATS